MRVKITFEVKPFPVPKIVEVDQDPLRKTTGLKQVGEVMLKDLSNTELEELCTNFRLDVLAEAKRQRDLETAVAVKG